jgi:hypothetical protein
MAPSTTITTTTTSNKENAPDLDSFRAELDAKLQRLKNESFTAQSKQHQRMVQHLVSLPKSMKTMTIREFNVLAGNNCDLLQMIQARHVATATVQVDTTFAAAVKTTITNNNTITTPSHKQQHPNKLSKSMLETPSRSRRRGETVLSQNGSPIELEEDDTSVLTVVKKKGKKSFDIHVGDGRYVPIDELQTALTSPERLEAQEQLALLHEQVSSAMLKLMQDGK